MTERNWKKRFKSMKPRIVMLAMNDVLNDPRVQREARMAVSEGFEVFVIGLCSDRTTLKEKKDGYWIYRLDHRDPVTRWFDEYPLKFIKNTGIYKSLNRMDKKLRSKIKKNTGAVKTKPDPMAEERSHRKSIIKLNKAMAWRAAFLKPHIIHSNDLDTLLAGSIAREKTGAKVVYDAHELWNEQQERVPRSQEWRDYFRNLELTLVPSVDRVITVNDFIGKELIKQYGAKEFTTVYNCPYLEKPSQGNSGFLNKKAYGKKIVLFQGRYEIERGLEAFVESARFIKNALLVLRGYGELEESLKKIAEDPAVYPNIYFAEPVPMKDLVQAASEADIGIISYLPTCLNNELCSPNKIFEYMMAGLAVIASDLPVLRQIIGEGDIGSVFKAGDPKDIARVINELTEDEARLKKCRENSLKLARKYSWENEGKKLMEVYKDLLKTCAA